MSFLKVAQRKLFVFSEDRLNISLAKLKFRNIFNGEYNKGVEFSGKKKLYVKKTHNDNTGAWYQIYLNEASIDYGFNSIARPSYDPSTITIKSLKNISSFDFVVKIFDFFKRPPEAKEVLR